MGHEFSHNEHEFGAIEQVNLIIELENFVSIYLS